MLKTDTVNRLLSCKRCFMTQDRNVRVYSGIKKTRKMVRQEMLQDLRREKFFVQRPQLTAGAEKSLMALQPENAIRNPQTSVTVEILGEEYQHIDRSSIVTKWRQRDMVRRARRLLPMPISLTGFGDGKMTAYWRHQMKRHMINLQKQILHQTTPIPETLSPSLKLMFENYPEKVKEIAPEVYETYMAEKNKPEKETIETQAKAIMQFPHSFVESMFKKKEALEKAKSDEDSKEFEEIAKFPSGLVDKEYDYYLKHHHLMQYLALNLKNMPERQYRAEIEGWRNQLWLRNYGSPDPSIPPSQVSFNSRYLVSFYQNIVIIYNIFYFRFHAAGKLNLSIN